MAFIHSLMAGPVVVVDMNGRVTYVLWLYLDARLDVGGSDEVRWVG